MSPKKTHLYLVLMTVLYVFPLQSQTLKWALNAGEFFDNETIGMTSDVKGNIIVAGEFLRSINLDPETPGNSIFGNGFSGIFVGKLDPDGKHIWSAGISNNSVCRVIDIASDKNDNIYLAGTFIGRVNFKLKSSTNTMIQSTGIGGDGFIAKYSGDGKLIWVRQIESKTRLNVKAMSVTSDGIIYLSGTYLDSTDFDPSASRSILTVVSPGIRPDIFLAQYDQDGQYQWAKKIGGDDANETINDIISSSNGNVYMTGTFDETVDFDPSTNLKNLTASGGNDIFLAAYDKNGGYLWANKIAGIGNEAGRALAIDKKNNLYLAGDFEGLIDINPSTQAELLTSSGGTDIFLAQYNTVTGAFNWGRQAGGPGNETCGSLACDSKQTLYFSGAYENKSSFDGKNSMASAGESDIFIAAYSVAGTFKSLVRTGGKGPDNNRCLHTDNNDHLFAAGGFSDTVDFNPSPNITSLKSQEDQNMFIAVYNLNCDPPAPPKSSPDKLSVCFNTSAEINAEGQGRISWHSAAEGGTLISKGKTYTTPQLIRDLSIFVQDSTCEAGTRTEVVILVNEAIDTGIILAGNTITARQTGAAYLWLDCDNNMKPIDGADKRTFSPAFNGHYAVIVSVDNCSSRSACVSFNALSLSVATPGNMRIYPNPVRDILNLTYPGVYTFRLYTADGRLLDEKTGETLLTVDMSAYHPGMYIVQIDDGNTTTVQKIMKDQ